MKMIKNVVVIVMICMLSATLQAQDHDKDCFCPNCGVKLDPSIWECQEDNDLDVLQLDLGADTLPTEEVQVPMQTVMVPAQIMEEQTIQVPRTVMHERKVKVPVTVMQERTVRVPTRVMESRTVKVPKTVMVPTQVPAPQPRVIQQIVQQPMQVIQEVIQQPVQSSAVIISSSAGPCNRPDCPDCNPPRQVVRSSTPQPYSYSQMTFSNSMSAAERELTDHLMGPPHYISADRLSRMSFPQKEALHTAEHSGVRGMVTARENSMRSGGVNVGVFGNRQGFFSNVVMRGAGPVATMIQRSRARRGNGN